MELSLNAARNIPVRQCLQVPRKCRYCYVSLPSKCADQGCSYVRLNYTWINQDRKSVHLPAPTYIDYVMTWVQNLLDDDNTFPTKSGTSASSLLSPPLSRERVFAPIKPGQDFPASFPSTIKHVYRQLLRVFAHIYHAHYPQILHLRSEPHFNSLFAHFLAFGREYELLDIKDVRGPSNAPAVGIGALWERWREMGILES